MAVRHTTFGKVRTGFNPSQINGCVAWFDASDSATISKDGSNYVDYWYSKLDAGVLFQQLGASKQPMWSDFMINSLPAIYFTTNDWMQSSSLSLDPATNGCEILIVKQLSFAGASDGVVLSQQDGSGTGRTILATTGTNGYATTDLGGTTLSGSRDLSSKTIASSISIEASSRNLYVDGTSINNDTASPESADGDFILGANKDTLTEFFDGYISEVLFFNRVLTNQERTAILNYLSNKWGVYHFSGGWQGNLDVVDAVAVEIGELSKNEYSWSLDNPKIGDFKVTTDYITKDGSDKVSGWSDDSRMFNWLSQLTADNQPTYIEDGIAPGVHSVKYDKTADSGNGTWLSSMTVPVSSYPFHIFVVVRVPEEVNTSRETVVCMADSSSSSKMTALGINTNDSAQVTRRNTTQYLTTGTTDLGQTPYTTPYVITAQYLSDTEAKVLVSTTVEATDTNTSTLSGSLNTFGFGRLLDLTPNLPFNGHQGRTVLFEGAMTDAQRDRVIAQALEKEAGI